MRTDAEFPAHPSSSATALQEAPRRESDAAILTLVGSDRPGIVAAISTCLTEHQANIVDAQQYTDQHAHQFFMRVEFDLRPRSSLAAVEQALAPITAGFGLETTLRPTSNKPVMGIMVSKLDHCLIDLLARHRVGELQVEIPVIISNHPDLEPIADAFGVAYEVVPVTSDTKPQAEARAVSILQETDCDFVVMARYMQVLGPTFLSAYPLRVINIHHGFLPAFPGARPYHQAFERGVKAIGATSHYATSVLDDGPIITQDVISVTHRDDPAELIRKGRDIERVVLSRSVRAHAEARVIVTGRRTVVFD